MSLTPGTLLGPYEIVGSLGAGGMGACGHASPRTHESEGEHQRQYAAGVGPRGECKKWTPSPFRVRRWR